MATILPLQSDADTKRVDYEFPDEVVFKRVFDELTAADDKKPPVDIEIRKLHHPFAETSCGLKLTEVRQGVAKGELNTNTSHANGYDGPSMFGGVLGGAFDGLMAVAAQSSQDQPDKKNAVTVDFTQRFRLPVGLNEKLTIEARLDPLAKGMFKTVLAEAKNAMGKVVSRAVAKFSFVDKVQVT